MSVRLMLAAGALLGIGLFAAPPLTTIQDVLYRADGTRFNGVLQITWNSFEAADTSNIAQQAISVRVVDGNLRVQLVPTTNSQSSATYTVKYSSDGKVQFQETWAVTSSAVPLRVRDVRVTSPAGIEEPTTTLQESDIAGLVADLGARPVKGSGFAPGRAALINASGMIEGVTGDAADCVHVDGSSGPCGSGFVDGETPGGIVDGSNGTFTLVSAPQPATSLALFRNGILQKPGQDFTLTNSAIQFLSAAIPQPGDTLLASYRLLSASSPMSTQTVLSAPMALAAVAPAPSAPQVLCAGTGAGSGEASCTVSSSTWKAGDRVEIHFDYARAQATGSFAWEVRWGGTVAASGSANDGLISGRIDAALYESGAQVSWQAWGSTLPLSGGVLDAAGPLPSSIEFHGSTAQLRSFSVIRYPRPQSN